MHLIGLCFDTKSKKKCREIGVCVSFEIEYPRHPHEKLEVPIRTKVSSWVRN